MEEAFWMVWSPSGSAPTHQHYCLEKAQQEAERLARKVPGRKFYVLEALEMRAVDDMQRVMLVPPLPF